MTTPQEGNESPLSEAATVVCPYCGETVEIFVESDVRGEMVHDCEVCCNPWRLRVWRDEAGSHILVKRLDD